MSRNQTLLVVLTLLLGAAPCFAGELPSQDGLPPELTIAPKPALAEQLTSLQGLLTYLQSVRPAPGGGILSGLKGLLGGGGATAKAYPVPPELLALNAEPLRGKLVSLTGVYRRTGTDAGVLPYDGGQLIGHTQGGNNNPYCQDNPVTWLDWSQADTALQAFTARLLALRRQWLPLGARWYTGLPDAQGRPDLGWLRRGGTPLSDWDWTQSASRVLGALVGQPGRGGRTLLLLFNAEHEATGFQLPEGDWTPLLDTARSDDPPPRLPYRGHYPLQSRSVALLAGPPLAPVSAAPAPPSRAGD